MQETLLCLLPIFVFRLGACLGQVSHDIMFFLQIVSNLTVLADGRLQDCSLLES